MDKTEINGFFLIRIGVRDLKRSRIKLRSQKDFLPFKKDKVSRRDCEITHQGFTEIQVQWFRLFICLPSSP